MESWGLQALKESDVWNSWRTNILSFKMRKENLSGNE